MKCPCKNCLCVPICQSKEYNKLVECSLIDKYLIQPRDAFTRPIYRVKTVQKILRPYLWKYIFKGVDGKIIPWIISIRGGVPESG